LPYVFSDVLELFIHSASTLALGTPPRLEATFKVIDYRVEPGSDRTAESPPSALIEFSSRPRLHRGYNNPSTCGLGRVKADSIGE
jgi:hypothetical protein